MEIWWSTGALVKICGAGIWIYLKYRDSFAKGAFSWDLGIVFQLKRAQPRSLVPWTMEVEPVHGPSWTLGGAAAKDSLELCYTSASGCQSSMWWI
jgi:hypothetical protein